MLSMPTLSEIFVGKCINSFYDKYLVRTNIKKKA